MRIRSRLVRFLIWGFVLVCSILAGGVWFAFSHFTDSETAKELIRFHAKKFLPDSYLDMSGVEIKTKAGEINLKKISLKQTIDGQPFPTISIPWLQVRLSFWKVLQGDFQAKEVIVSQPTLQVCRRKDGTWNIQGLLANPWPELTIKDPPPIYIKNGTVELVLDDEQVPEQAEPLARPSSRNPGEAVETAQVEPARKVALLREVNLTVKSAHASMALEFEGTAKGDTFEKIYLEGKIDPTTGQMNLEGDLSRLTITEPLLERLPREVRPAVSALGLKAGEVNLSVNRLSVDPSAPETQRLLYDATARLSGGVWECKHMPFSISELSAVLTARDGELTIEHAEGHNGLTTLHVGGKLKIGPPDRMPFDIQVDLENLMLDDRLRARTPPEHVELWDVFKPTGKVDTAVHIVREKEGGLIGMGATVACRDVSGVYRHFPYPIEHMTGELKMQGSTIDVDLLAHVSGKPVVLKGSIEHPGPDAIVRLNIEAESVPVDQTLMDALPPDVRKVVNEFQPTGSARGSVKIFRKPTVGPMARPEGDFELNAVIDLQDRCAIRWAGFPYPVRNLTGRLIIHPDLWQFENMKGDNGQSLITVDGKVTKLPLPKLPNGEEPLKVEVAVKAQNLLLNNELRDSLQPAWRKTWNTIIPTGSTDVDAKVHIEPGRPDLVDVKIRPRANSNIRLVVPTLDPNFKPVLPMENVNGLFVFHNDRVNMSGVTFEFRGAEVSFQSGTVSVQDNGKFDLSVGNLWVSKIRFDSGFRKIMPQMMGSIAERLDDGKTITASGDLEIGWSGILNQPAWCRWKNTKVILTGNSIKAGIPLEHIQGQLEQVSGWSDGKSLNVDGKLDLRSVNILGQQITGLQSNFAVNTQIAQMKDIQGALLGGRLSGDCWISLDSPTTPRYGTRLLLQNAGLEQYALTVPGRQSYRGQINAGVTLQGLGTSIRSLRGEGWAKVSQGDLGELPLMFRFAKFLNENIITGLPRSTPKTAFDEAEVKFQIHDGFTVLSTINFIGNAFRLIGEGTLDPQGHLDIGLRVHLGRGSVRVPLFSEALNKVSREIVGVHVQGTPTNPIFEVKTLPELMRTFSRTRSNAESSRLERSRAITQ